MSGPKLIITATLFALGTAWCVVGQELPNTPALPLPAPMPATRRPSPLPSLLLDAPASTADAPAKQNPLPMPSSMGTRYTEQVKRIQEKMLRLAAFQKKLAEECGDLDKKPKPSNSDPTASGTPPTPVLVDQTPFANPVRPTDQPQPADTAAQPPVTLPVTLEVAPSTPELIVSSTHIDSMSFANNLFAQGKIEVARPVYEKLLTQPQEPEDLIWIQYQLASCYRLEKRIKDATKFYRIVAGEKNISYWPSRAQWWLDYIGRSEALLLRQQEIQQRVKALTEQVNALSE